MTLTVTNVRMLTSAVNRAEYRRSSHRTPASICSPRTASSQTIACPTAPQLLGKKLPCPQHGISLGARIRRNALALVAGVIEIVGGAGVKNELDVAGLRTAALDQPLTDPRRDLLVGVALQDAHRRVRLESGVEAAPQIAGGG